MLEIVRACWRNVAENVWYFRIRHAQGLDQDSRHSQPDCVAQQLQSQPLIYCNVCECVQSDLQLEPTADLSILLTTKRLWLNNAFPVSRCLSTETYLATVALNSHAEPQSVYTLCARRT
jgi:hypothetical protein